jgi:peptide deformylase
MLRLPNDLYELTKADLDCFSQELAVGMVLPSDKILSRPVKRIPEKSIEGVGTKGIISKLEVAASGQRANSPKGKKRRILCGLAAPQIGIDARIVLIDTRIRETRKMSGKYVCLINPEVIWRSRETSEGREGCFSAGPIWGLVRRPVAVKIMAWTPDGKRVEHIYEGFTARIIQHEIDHLSGVRFPDRIRLDKKRHWVHVEELESYRDNFLKWHRLCDMKRWEAYKLGVVSP